MVAASALVLKPRDRWIGRDAAGREAHLDRVVGLARFLIRPSLACRTLASTVLGLCLGRLADDDAARYGVAPLPVETFVGPAHGGISLRVTNRVHVGMTAGRGCCAACGRSRRCWRFQDGSDLNVATHRACRGLGVIAKTKGFAGTLGLPRIAFEAPDCQADKKTQRWLRGWRDISRLTAGLANTRAIAVMDRESDVINLFCAWCDEGGADLLVRAMHDRGLAEETILFERMRAALADGRPADLKRWRSEPEADPVTLTPVHLREDTAPSGEGARGSNGC